MNAVTAFVPFAHAKLYRDLGWLGTIPLPARCKKEPPKGWTGHGAPYPSADVQAWLETEVGIPVGASP